MKNLKFLACVLMLGTCLIFPSGSFANHKNNTAMVKNFDIVPATQPIVSLEQAKAQLRIEPEYEIEDALIEQMAASAEAWCKEYLGRELAYTLVVDLDVFGTLPVEMTCLRDASLTKIEYVVNEDREYADLPADNYKFRKIYTGADLYEVTFKGTLPALPAGNDRAVRIHMACACPEPVRSAILLRLSDLYERREDRNVNPASDASVNLMRPYKANW